MVRQPTPSRVQGAHIAAAMCVFVIQRDSPRKSRHMALKRRLLDSKPHISHSADHRQAGCLLVDFGVDCGGILFEKKDSATMIVKNH
jgi:hypothetical protein